LKQNSRIETCNQFISITLKSKCDSKSVCEVRFKVWNRNRYLLCEDEIKTYKSVIEYTKSKLKVWNRTCWCCNRNLKSNLLVLCDWNLKFWNPNLLVLCDRLQFKRGRERRMYEKLKFKILKLILCKSIWNRFNIEAGYRGILSGWTCCKVWKSKPTKLKLNGFKNMQWSLVH